MACTKMYVYLTCFLFVIEIKALRVLMETMSCDFSSCRLAECIFVDDILGIFEFVYCIFF